MRDRIRDLELEVHNLKVAPAAIVRARGRSRARRQLAVTVAAGAVVLTTAGLTIGWPQQQQHAAPIAAAPGLSCVLDLPRSPSEIRIRVLDGGAPAGLPATTAAQLRERSYSVLDGTPAREPSATTTLRYGPTSIGAAALLIAVLHGETTMQFDPDRTDEAVDVILGPSFTRLATTTELNQTLTIAGPPTAPAECTPATPSRSTRPTS
ncbi:LytR C-terminal domain-containing protein [Actinoplanes sp. NPDC051494]|uniref:LytR C-terminal domain-containing protein n=1 Tax=Actinoplanes sp. NPDC051494 TaxID=3363907 RepID=UPI0037992FC3